MAPKSLKGDIELDINVADWERHGHGDNPAFRNVVLHLFLQNSGSDFFTRTIDHREVVQVQLKTTGLTLTDTESALAKPGACCSPLSNLPEAQLDQIIETAARIRLEKKRWLCGAASGSTGSMKLFSKLWPSVLVINGTRFLFLSSRREPHSFGFDQIERLQKQSYSVYPVFWNDRFLPPNRMTAI